MNRNLSASPMKNPLIVALDVDTQEKALQLVDDLADVVGGFKLGPRLCLRYGMDLVKKVAQRAPVFLDNKHFDIPSTMEAAVRASFEAGASLVTVHALSGKEALQRMAHVEKELNQQRPFRILAVTILTSWDESSVPGNLKSQPISQHVLDLVSLVETSGLKGIVCSPHELDLLQNRDLYLVTPGIRSSMQNSGDQKRIMGPREALDKGASALVVGRPILEAANIKEAAAEFTLAIYEKKVINLVLRNVRLKAAPQKIPHALSRGDRLAVAVVLAAPAVLEGRPRHLLALKIKFLATGVSSLALTRLKKF